MKILVLLGLIFSGFAQADLVYMQENAKGKSVVLKTDLSSRVLNDARNSLWAIYPDITPSGLEVIFSEGPGPTDLHLTHIDLKTETTERFHHTQKGMLLHPKFSKNGEWIFYSAPRGDGKNTIYYFNRKSEITEQGAGLTDYALKTAKALDATEESYFPRPSSDANFVVYQRNSADKKEIILFDRLESKKKVIAQGMSPALSFDERWIAYTSKINGNWDVFVTERTSGITFQATSDAADEQAPTFLPDNTLVFASNKTGKYRLYKLVSGKWETIELATETADADFYSPQSTGDTKIVQGLKPNFIGNSRSSFGTVVHEGKLYMCGGHQGAEHTYPPESFSDQFIVFDTQTNTWKELAPRPAKAHGYQLAAHGNYIYAFGGFAYSEIHKPRWKSLDQIDRYDIKNNKWETIGKLTFPRSSNVAVTIEGKVYLAGGWNSTPKFENDLDGIFHDTIEVFDLQTEKSELAPFKIPTPVRRALTGIAVDNKLVLIGGLGQGASHFELLSQVTMIDPKDGTFKELPPLPFATFAPAAEILSGKLFVFGGMFKTGPMNYEYVSHIYSLDLNSQRWEHTGRSLKETKGFSQVFKLDDETLGILGGHHYFAGHDSPVSTFETLRVKP